MKTTLTLLKAAAVTALMLSPAARVNAANAAAPKQLTIKDVAGAVRIQQSLPCGNTMDLTTPVARGFMQVTVSPVTRGQVLVDLTRLSMFLRPFRADASCNGVRASVDFREVGVQLASAVKVKADGALDSNLIYFTIPREQFLLYESVLNNAPGPQPQSGYQRPSEDVTGVIDVRRQTVQLHVAMQGEMRFRAGCDGDRCVIDEVHTGTVTSDIRGSGAPATVARK